MIDITSISFDDEKVWGMIGEGKVKGCFQIESHLGKTWCKALRPENLGELAALISVIRPGCLKAKGADGKSMTQHYVDRKHGEEEVVELYHSINDILEKTYGVMVFQEQAMKIAQRMAGFDLKEADNLRKAIGKKKADLMNKVRIGFIDGCVKNGIDEAKAIEVFDIIEKSNRYSFNASHAVAYATMAYWSAWLKYYHPINFYKIWLRNSSEKIKPDLEKKQLILSAKAEGINIAGPSILKLEEKFFWDSDNDSIRFGICDVKNVGSAHLLQLRKSLQDIDRENWISILTTALPSINKRAIENLISVGAFACCGKSRTSMLHELSCFLELTKKEMEFFKEHLDPSENLESHLRRLISLGTKSEGGFISSKNRISKVESIVSRLANPGRSLDDNPASYAKIEEKLLGYNVNELDSCSDASYADSTCHDVNNGKFSKSVLAVIIKKFREHKTKNKDMMAFLSVEDESGELENVVVFPEIYEQSKDIMYEGATVLITGEITDKKRKSFIVTNVFQI